MPKLKLKYNVIDLFCGCGGASLGLELIGCRVVGAVDTDPIACKVYEENLGLEPICGDLRRVNGNEILKHYGLGKKDIDFVAGCPPCQGFSSLQRTRGLRKKDTRNDLVRVFLKRVQELRPRVAIFENVPGIATLHRGRYLDLYLGQMGKFGYKSACEILDVANYGVPQHRRRTVTFSVKGIDDKEELSMPLPSHSNPKYANETGKPPWVTVREAISGLPPLEAGESDPAVPNHKARNHTPRVLEIIRNVPKNGGSRSDLPRSLWLKCHLRLNDGGAENVYGRMWWGRPSPTITSRCTCPSSGRFIHPEQDRAITPREAARLQTFPDDFFFPDEIGLAERYIGNAVPPIFIGNLVRYFVGKYNNLL